MLALGRQDFCGLAAAESPRRHHVVRPDQAASRERRLDPLTHRALEPRLNDEKRAQLKLIAGPLGIRVMRR